MSAPAPQHRTLVLLRHAKSAWPDVPDHDRPLAPRGLRDAPVMGRWLRAAGHLPDRVLCSSARRTRETWQLVREQLGIDPPVTFDEQIYGAMPDTLLELIHRVEPTCRTLLVVGHFPGVPSLAWTLPGTDADPALVSRMVEKFPTAAVAVVEFGGEWGQLASGTARLAAFVTPRELHAEDGETHRIVNTQYTEPS